MAAGEGINPNRKSHNRINDHIKKKIQNNI